jgi:hypothetical protein
VNSNSNIEAARQWVFRCESAQGVAQWRWACRDREGVAVAASGEGFPSLQAAIENARRHGFPV